MVESHGMDPEERPPPEGYAVPGVPGRGSMGVVSEARHQEKKLELLRRPGVYELVADEVARRTVTEVTP
jgi:hypothetical protein